MKIVDYSELPQSGYLYYTLTGPDPISFDVVSGTMNIVESMFLKMAGIRGARLSDTETLAAEMPDGHGWMFAKAVA